mgnify:CR=1 FL=1
MNQPVENKIKNDFNEEGWIAGFKSIWDNIGLWEATITGGIGLYLMKKILKKYGEELLITYHIF